MAGPEIAAEVGRCRRSPPLRPPCLSPRLGEFCTSFHAHCTRNAERFWRGCRANPGLLETAAVFARRSLLSPALSPPSLSRADKSPFSRSPVPREH